VYYFVGRYILFIAECYVCLSDNTYASYNEHGERIGLNSTGMRELQDIISDISTSFVILIGIVFPSVTGDIFLLFFHVYHLMLE